MTLRKNKKYLSSSTMADPLVPPQPKPFFFVAFLADHNYNPMIPDEFFSTHLEDRNEFSKLKLTSDAFDRTWEVKLNGRRFADGWEDFSAAHSLRHDDVLIFKHHGEMIFHTLAKHFTMTNGLNKRWCVIDLMNQSGKSWVHGLRHNKKNGQDFIRGGWRSFCLANELKLGISYRFKLVRNGKRPLLQLCSDITPQGSCSKAKGKAKVSTKSSREGKSASMKRNKFLTVTLKPYMLKSRHLRLPRHFARENGIKKAGEITLVDKDGVKWPSYVVYATGQGSFYMAKSFKDFCEGSGIKTGETFTLEFVREEGTTPMLKFYSKAKAKIVQIPRESSGQASLGKEEETETRFQKRARLSSEEGPSRRSQTPNKSTATQKNLQCKQPLQSCSFSDQLTKVKQSTAGILTDVRRFRSEVEIKEKILEALLQELDALGKIESTKLKLTSDAFVRTWEVKLNGRRFAGGWEYFAATHCLRDDDVLVFRNDGDMRFHSLQKGFARANGLIERHCEIDLMNQHGKSWTLDLRYIRTTDQARIRRGWTDFCLTNGLEAGSVYRFKFVRNGTRPLIRLCSGTIPKGNCSKQSGRYHLSEKPSSGCSASESASVNKFLTITFKPYMLKSGQLRLTRNFARENGIKKAGEITLVDKYGVKWPSYLKPADDIGRFYIAKGWRSFCAANRLETGESFTLQFVRGKVSTPMLKFCSKVKAKVNKYTSEYKYHLMAPEGQVKHHGMKKKRLKKKQKLRARVSEGGSSRRSLASDSSASDLKTLQRKEPFKPCSISDQINKVKQCIKDTLSGVRRFQSELEKKEQNLEASLEEIDVLEKVLDFNKTLNSRKI
ncbi:unnamed protein product [Thlaspi arvense]|uniref:TF-B3 domain-containing protein n=1 Tax=Thlaspi arvense TaxID=13288 RepID=A0AAU9T044_THLAR|nr:unnamed protein product [Thlaspi arvense]